MEVQWGGEKAGEVYSERSPRRAEPEGREKEEDKGGEQSVEGDGCGEGKGEAGKVSLHPCALATRPFLSLERSGKGLLTRIQMACWSGSWSLKSSSSSSSYMVVEWCERAFDDGQDRIDLCSWTAFSGSGFPLLELLLDPAGRGRSFSPDILEADGGLDRELEWLMSGSCKYADD